MVSSKKILKNIIFSDTSAFLNKICLKSTAIEFTERYFTNSDDKRSNDFSRAPFKEQPQANSAIVEINRHC